MDKRGEEGLPLAVLHMIMMEEEKEEGKKEAQIDDSNKEN